MSKSAIVAPMVGLCLCCAPALADDVVTTVVTDADAYVRSDPSSTDWRDWNDGTSADLCVATRPFVEKFYLHFDLASLDAGLEVLSAYLRVDWEKSRYVSGVTGVFAIMDEAKDWDVVSVPEAGPGAITYNTAPQVDLSSSDPTPVPFLEEATGVGAVTRELGSALTPSPGHVDLDVTDLVSWALGQNAGYSSFADTDDELTFAFRESLFQDSFYRSREDTPGDDGDAPRLVVTQAGPELPIPGDTNDDGCLDGGDYTIWADNYLNQPVPAWADGGWAYGNFNDDDIVDGGDYTIWADNYNGSCQPVPEPAAGALLVVGAAAMIRRGRRLLA
jgi:hypothetical protein